MNDCFPFAGPLATPPVTSAWREFYPNATVVAGFEGGGVYAAERDGVFYLISDETTMREFAPAGDLPDSLVKRMGFRSRLEREIYCVGRRWMHPDQVTGPLPAPIVETLGANGDGVGLAAIRETRMPGGVASIWLGEQLISAVTIRGELRRSVESSLSGTRSRSRTALAVCDRFVVPDLTGPQLTSLRAGILSLDDLTEHLLHTGAVIRWIEIVDPRQAKGVAVMVNAGALGVASLVPPPPPRKRAR